MTNSKQAAGVPLIDSGIPREELEQAIAKLYMETLRAKSSSQPDTVRDYHLDFARAILDRAFYRLEYITNGLNVSGKRTFCEVTGVQLPNANGAARKMLMEWAGIDPLQDAILEARRLVKVWYDSAARQLGNMDDVVKKVEQWYEAGLVQMVKVNRAYYVLNRAGTAGLNTSEKGFRGGIVRPYIEAFLELQKLRVEAGEIQEPAWVDPQTPAAPTQSGLGF